MATKLISTELSKCCRSEAQIVKSREGGFLSRNCLCCGEPAYVNASQIPRIQCDMCKAPMQVEKLDGSNYFYRCRQCSRSHKISELVPRWNEVFQYSGLAAHGDDCLIESNCRPTSRG